MAAVTSWVTQIVLLILLAIILELLLPNESFKRYVKMVIGLVLIVALLNPVVKLFHLPSETILNQFELNSGNDFIKNSIKINKSDIEASQRAYILKQMAVQMKNLVQEELISQYDLAIQNINIKLDDSKGDKLPVQNVSVTLGQAPSQNQQQSTVKPVTAIKKVQINVSQDNRSDFQNEQSSSNQKQKTSKKTKQIIELLAKKWQLPADKLTVTMDGGDS